jgi:hypothetical protein
VKLRFDRLGAHRGLRISERIRRIFVQLATPNAKQPYFGVTLKNVVRISKAPLGKKRG